MTSDEGANFACFWGFCQGCLVGKIGCFMGLGEFGAGGV